MVNAALVQARINKGYGKAGKALGESCTVYRPNGITNPIVSGNAVQTGLLSWFNPDASFTKVLPNLYGKPVWGASLDRTNTQVGDYLVAPSGTYFIVAQQPILATAVVSCNRVISVVRPNPAPPGQQYYGGVIAGQKTALLTSWPASVLNGTKGEKGLANLPGDARMPWMQVLLPVTPGVTLRTSDEMTTDQNETYILSACELTDLGWRITAMKAAT